MDSCEAIVSQICLFLPRHMAVNVAPAKYITQAPTPAQTAPASAGDHGFGSEFWYCDAERVITRPTSSPANKNMTLRVYQLVVSDVDDMRVSRTRK